MSDIQKFKEWIWKAYNSDKLAFANAAKDFFKEEAILDGWAAEPLMGILNFIVSQCFEKDESYLEIGTYAGRSLVGALKGNNVHGYVVDNFWDNETLLPKFQDNLIKFNIQNRVGIYHGDSSTFNVSLPKIGLLFYDANHDRGHTHFNLNLFEKYLSNEAIIIVDDIEIEAGIGHQCYPGYIRKSNMPVLDDVIEWLRDHPKCDLFMLTPWTLKQAVVTYYR